MFQTNLFSVKRWFLISVMSLIGLYSCTVDKNRISSANLNEDNSVVEKQKGAHVFGRADSTGYRFLLDNNYEWLTLVPWGFQKSYDTPSVRHERDTSRTKERNARLINQIEYARSVGLKVFVKPHIWMHDSPEDKWRSDIYPTSDENWELWMESYREFIVRYATLAEQANAEMFCIGTEFTRLTLEKTSYWEALIKEVRTIYSGKITYAANWYKEYDRIQFWDQLDYIGVQAYFPLVNKNNPTVKEISKGWQKHLPVLESVSQKFNRKILFTEMGYKSTPNSAVKPWEWAEYGADAKKDYSAETQVNCYESFFKTVWNKKWFAGVHIWQLRNDFGKNDRNVKYDFSPQGKPAEATIAKGFKH